MAKDTELKIVPDQKSEPAKEDAPAPAQMVPFKQLFHFADKLDVVLMVLGSLGALLNGTILPLFSLIFGQMINAFNDPTNSITDLISTYALYFVYVGIGAFVFSYMEVTFWTISGERQSRRIREAYLKAILTQDIGWFDTTKTTELTTRIAGDTVKMQEAISEKVGNYLHFMGTFIAGFVMGFVSGWIISLTMMCSVPLLALCGAFLAKLMGSLSERGQQAYAKAGGIAEEVLGSLRTVVSFVGEKKESERYNAAIEEAYQIGMKKALLTGLSLGVTMFIMFASYSLALGVGSKLVADKTTNTKTGEPYTGGDILTVFFAVLMGAFAIGQAAPNLAAFSSGKGAAYHFFETLKRVPGVASNIGGPTLKDVTGSISIRDVYFEYPARPGIVVANGLNLEIPAGSQVALVGESGSGKSTIVALLERFYDPRSGVILLDGLDIKSADLHWLRSQMGLVSQEPALFGTSIYENIRYGRPDATEEQIIEAAKMANAHDFISTLPQGYHTEVGDRGSQLSGGQKQRIAIARAIIRNPKILLLDEATSALDNESEKIVQAALDRLMVGRTTIVIAHRLSTIRNVDMIVVMEKGVVIEQGSHADLVARNGHYMHLLSLQQTAGLGEEASGASARESNPAAAAIPSFGDAGLRQRNAATSLVEPGKPTALSAQKKLDDKDEKAFEEVPEGYSVPFLRVMGLAKDRMPYFIVGLLASIANGVAMPIFSIIFSEMTKVFYLTDPEEVRKQGLFWAGMFLVLGGGMFVANLFQNWGLGAVSERITVRMREKCFYGMLHQDMTYFDDEKNTTGMLTTRLSREATLVQGATATSSTLLLQNIATLVCGLVIAFTNGWKLTLVLLCVLPLIAASGMFQMKLMAGFAAKGAHEAAGKIATESIENARIAKAFLAEQRLLDLYSKKLDVPYRDGLRKSHISGVGLGFSQLVLFCTYGGAFYYGSVLIERGEMNFGQVLQLFMSVMMSAMGLGQTSSLMPDMTKAKSACSSLFSIIDRVPPVISDSEDGLQPPRDTIRGAIDFVGIKFAYPSRPSISVCNNLNLSVPAGQQVALVGPSGCGKSTLISLVQRFYDPLAGQILLDGTDIKSFNLKYLRKMIGLVGQEPILFNCSIKENITYGMPKATQEQIEEASRSANAYDFILAQPQGFDTNVGARGTQLSGGQKQRIAIARAVLKDPILLLLDEATSALDSDSEKVVQEALTHIMVGKTTLIIAHRLSTIVNSHKIAVVNSGAVVEEGSYQELLANGGAFSVLAGRAGLISPNPPLESPPQNQPTFNQPFVHLPYEQQQYMPSSFSPY